MALSKKLTAIFLSVILLIPALASCKNEAENQPEAPTETGEVTENPAEETEPETEEILPLGIPSDVKYDGATFTIEAVDNRGGVGAAVYNPFSLEGINGDLLNDIVYNACLKVENRLDIDLTQAYSANVWDYGRLKIAATSGDGSIDAFSYIDRFGTAQASGGYVIPYEKIPNIDLDNPWWFGDVNEAVSIANHYCFAIGAMNLDVVSNMQCILFNKTILSDLNLDNPYELVKEGKWTIDRLYSMIENAVSDSDGDGNMTVSDRWGAVYTHDVWYNNFGPVSGSYIVEKDADDLPVFDVVSNERLLTIWDTLMNYTNQGNSFIVSFAGDTKKYNLDGSIYNEVLYMFRDGKALFSSSPSMNSIALLRDMEDDFGILPFPHYEEEAPGTSYGSYVNGIGQPFFVPISNIDPARCGYVFEALCYEYYYNVIGDYLDGVAMTKQTRDADSAEMLNMMYQNKKVDISSGYWWEATNQTMYEIFRSKNNTFASSYKKVAKASNKQIEKTVEMFKAFENFGKEE